jgi:hypothetical protein
MQPSEQFDLVLNDIKYIDLAEIFNQRLPIDQEYCIQLTNLNQFNIRFTSIKISNAKSSVRICPNLFNHTRVESFIFDSNSDKTDYFKIQILKFKISQLIR